MSEDIPNISDIIRRVKNLPPPQIKPAQKPPKVLVFDVECSTTEFIVRQYGLRVQNAYFKGKQIQRDWVMLGAAWKWFGEQPITCLSVKHTDVFNDFEVVRTLYNAVSEADILIGHNMQRFDLKKLKARAIFYDMPPLPKITVVDTLTIARQQFEVTSNELAYLCRFLGLETQKARAPDWEAILDGSEEELRYMRKYNRLDVKATEELYLKLRGWHTNHPKMTNFYQIRDIEGRPVPQCPKCLDGGDAIYNGSTATKGRKRKIFCKTCRSHSTV